MGEIQISKTLRELRVRKGLTQAEFGKKLNVARQTYSAYEQGTRCPDLEVVCRAAELCQVSLDWLVFAEEPGGRDPFASLPREARDLCRIFYALSPGRQRTLLEFAEYLEQKES